jgi:hypothetical protein
MKLELKHIAAYLPYGLKILTNNGEAKSYIKSLHSLSIFYSYPLVNSKDKPILRPLSDLKTSHNIFEDKAICFIDESDNGGSFTIDDIYFKYKESSFSDWRNAYLLLLENHFDVFGLIAKGLAINVNDL